MNLKREKELAEKGWKVSRTRNYSEMPKRAIGKEGYPYAILNKDKTYETFYTWKEKPIKKGKKSMKEIIKELRKPPKPSGRTYIKGIIKEQKEYKKLEKTMGKKKNPKQIRKRTLFKPPKHKYLAKLITYKSVEDAEKSVLKLDRMFRDAKTKKKKLRIVRSMQYAENRITGGFLKKKNLKPETKQRLKGIASTYGYHADILWSKYNKLK